MEEKFSQAVSKLWLIFGDDELEKEFYLFKDSCEPLSKLVKRIGFCLFIVGLLINASFNLISGDWKVVLGLNSIIILGCILHFIPLKSRRIQFAKGGFLILSLGVCYCERTILYNPDNTKGLHYGIG